MVTRNVIESNKFRVLSLRVCATTTEHLKRATLNTNIQIVGNKAKEQISKRMLQENEARQIFRNSPNCLITDELTPKRQSLLVISLKHSELNYGSNTAPF